MDLASIKSHVTQQVLMRMTVYFKCSDAQALEKDFIERVALGKKPGGIAAWKIDSKGRITHVADRLEESGFLKAKIVKKGENEWLAFNYDFEKGVTLEDRRFAYKELSGNILATFIEHFTGSFTKAEFIDKRSKG